MLKMRRGAQEPCGLSPSIRYLAADVVMANCPRVAHSQAARGHGPAQPAAAHPGRVRLHREGRGQRRRRPPEDPQLRRQDGGGHLGGAGREVVFPVQ